MPFSVYDPDGVRLLSTALAHAMEIVRKSAAAPLTESEAAFFRKRIADKLMEVLDSGERDLSALNRAGLETLFPSTAKF